MSTHSNAMPGSRLESRAVAPTLIPPTRLMYWSLQRELWEYRSIYIAPLGVAALFLLGFLISTVHLADKMRAALTLNPMQQQEFIQQPYDLAALLIMGTTFLVAIFYSLDALHGERRDRSILFWKSLPVSDLTTVLSKASIPLVVLPLITFAVTVVTQWIMLLLSVAVLSRTGLTAMLWTHLPLFQMWLDVLFHLVTVHSLYYSPIFAWLLLVSAWARRAPFLWASLPLLAIGVVEKIAFNTTHFATMLMNRVAGGSEAVPYPMPAGMSMHSMAQMNLVYFLSSPGLWIGLALTAAFLAAAVRLRRYQGPI
jgi:ABC-2 type transport system permease protein